MKPEPTMTPEEIETFMDGRPRMVDKQKAIKRRRAYTVEELWELWTEWQLLWPHNRDGAEFLLMLEKK